MHRTVWILIGCCLLLVVVLVGLSTNWWARESYPRLVPWEIAEVRSETEWVISALSYACVLGGGGNEEAVETLDRVAVYETVEAVTIETWLGPSDRKWRFWRGCEPATGYGFPAKVQLESPLGDRTLIDPACALERHARASACRAKVPFPRR